MIKPQCDKCGKELQEFGAIILSPPNKKSLVRKYHICKYCFKFIEKLIIINNGKYANGSKLS